MNLISSLSQFLDITISTSQHLNAPSAYLPRDFFSECELSLYAIARPSVVCLSVTIVHPTQAVEIFGNISTALGTMATL